MQLKSSEYFKEAIRTDNDQLRYQLMSKGCKQISQILPFQSMWNILLKQDKIFFYMLMLQSMFGQNIKMLLELIIERFSQMTQFQIQFLNACIQIFQQDYDQLSSFIQQNVQAIFQECIIQLQCFIKQIPKNDSKEGIAVAEQIINAYKTIFQNIHNQQVTMELYMSLENVAHKWPRIVEINPLIFHEVQDIIATRTPRNYEVQMYFDEMTECESPTRSQSIRKDNQVVVELQRWLSKMNYEVPVISKRIASSVINSQNLFKLRENIEILLSFIFTPLKYDIAHCWSRVQLPKIQLKDIPNLKEAHNLDGQASQYHIRSIRTLQCLMDDENHGIIAKVNPNYLKIVFEYWNDCFQEDECKYCNYNHLSLLLESYFHKEQDITVYYILHFNIPYQLMLYFQYEQVGTFLTHFLLQSNPFGSYYSQSEAAIYEQSWRYLQASHYFQDLIEYLYNRDYKINIQMKANPDYRSIEMIESFTLRPDFKLRESVHDIHQSYDGHVTEEKVHLLFDFDLLKPYIQKKTMRALSFFRKVSTRLLPSNNNFQNPALMEVIRSAIEEASLQEGHGPIKKRFKRPSTNPDRERVIVLRSASIVTFDQEDYVKEVSPFEPTEIQVTPSLQGCRIDTKDSGTFDKRSQSQNTQRNKLEKRRCSILYPQSLKDLTPNEFDHLEKQGQYTTENLIKREQAVYNGIQFFSILVQQLINQESFKLKRLSYLSTSEQYLSILMLDDNCKIFKTLMKIYLFRIKISKYVKDNSAIICGRLVNLIIKKLPKYCCLQDNAGNYLDYIGKLFIKQLHDDVQQLEIDLSQLTLLETIVEILQSQIKIGNTQIFNKLSPTVWSCFIEMYKVCSYPKPNYIFQNLFLTLIKLLLQNGTEFNIFTVFLKLNFLSALRDSASQLTHAVNISKQNTINQFNHQLIQVIQNAISKNHTKVQFKGINSLECWKQLKMQFNIRDHQHANSFYSTVDQSRAFNSTPSSMARIRIRKTNQSISQTKID